MSRSLFDPMPPDPCANKHGGNEQSAAAYQRGKGQHGSTREAIVEMLLGAGSHGLTREEIATKLERQTHKISGRITELLGEYPPRVVESGATRKTESGASAAVLVHVEHLGTVLGAGRAERPSALRERM